MGLDIDILTHDNEEMVSFRSHEILLDRLNAVVEDTERPCLLYTSPSPRDRTRSRMPSSA